MQVLPTQVVKTWYVVYSCLAEKVACVLTWKTFLSQGPEFPSPSGPPGDRVILTCSHMISHDIT